MTTDHNRVGARVDSAVGYFFHGSRIGVAGGDQLSAAPVPDPEVSIRALAFFSDYFLYETAMNDILDPGTH